MYSIAVNKDRYKSPNYSVRRTPIDTIIIHHTGGSFPGCAEWLCNPDPRNADGMELGRVSAHFVITKKPEIYQLVEVLYKAWHAGQGAFDVNRDGTIGVVERMWNDRSIGIELEAVKTDGYTYTPAQLHALERLVFDLMAENNIVPEYILGHKEIAPGRKIDPANFDMQNFRNKIAESNIWNT